MRDHFRRFAAYNRWANERLYAACAALPEAEYKASRPAFFGSIHRTLNHILLADRIWLDRLLATGAPALPLDTELCTSLAELSAARAAEDDRIAAYVDGLDGAALGRAVSYRNTRGIACDDACGVILQHFFNHQTHHRGQVHDMLMATPVAPPSLDLILFERERAQPVTNSSRA